MLRAQPGGGKRREGGRAMCRQGPDNKTGPRARIGRGGLAMLVRRGDCRPAGGGQNRACLAGAPYSAGLTRCPYRSIPQAARKPSMAQTMESSISVASLNSSGTISSVEAMTMPRMA